MEEIILLISKKETLEIIKESFNKLILVIVVGSDFIVINLQENVIAILSAKRL